jgi:hypothetical protein
MIERTMAFAKQRAAEQALAETPKPILPVTADKPIVRQSSERDEIRQRINNFRAHQEKNGTGGRGLLFSNEGQNDDAGAHKFKESPACVSPSVPAVNRGKIGAIRLRK